MGSSSSKAAEVVGKEGGPIWEESGATRSTRVCPWLPRNAALGSDAVLLWGEAAFSSSLRAWVASTCVVRVLYEHLRALSECCRSA